MHNEELATAANQDGWDTGNMKCIQNLFENLKGTDHLGNLRGHGKIILKSILQKQGCVNWIYVTQ